MDYQIVPAIIVQDIVNLKDRLTSVTGAVEWAQVDIMDGEFVENFSIDVQDILSVENKPKISFHLMVKDPIRYIQKCKDAGGERVIFHYEATDYHSDVIQKIDELGMEKGIALNPETPIIVVRDFIHRVGVVLLLAVKPGFGGQDFIPDTFDKIKELRKISPSVDIGVDGGINEVNIKEIKNAGANIFVIGSAIYFFKDRKRAIEKLKHKIK